MFSMTLSVTSSNHAYNVPELVQLACSFTSKIKIRNGYSVYDAKSIMGMLTMNRRDGSLTVTADGPDEEAAVKAICKYITGSPD